MSFFLMLSVLFVLTLVGIAGLAGRAMWVVAKPQKLKPRRRPSMATL